MNKGYKRRSILLIWYTQVLSHRWSCYSYFDEYYLASARAIFPANPQLGFLSAVLFLGSSLHFFFLDSLTFFSAASRSTSTTPSSSWLLHFSLRTVCLGLDPLSIYLWAASKATHEGYGLQQSAVAAVGRPIRALGCQLTGPRCLREPVNLLNRLRAEGRTVEQPEEQIGQARSQQAGKTVNGQQ